MLDRFNNLVAAYKRHSLTQSTMIERSAEEIQTALFDSGMSKAEAFAIAKRLMDNIKRDNWEE